MSNSATLVARPARTAALVAIALIGALIGAAGGTAAPALAQAGGSFRLTAPPPGGAAKLLTGPACRASPAPGYCGKLLLGGSGGSTFVYDPSTETYGTCAVGESGCPNALKPGKQDPVRGGPSATLGGSACEGASPPGYCGKLLMVGRDGAALYDPATGIWAPGCSASTATASCPAPYPISAVSGQTATSLADGRVLFAGGNFATDFPVVVRGRREFAVYNPATGQWTSQGLLYNFRQQHAAILLQGPSDQCSPNCGKVLIIGGDGTSQQTAELFDPQTNTSVGTDPPKAPRRGSFGVALLASGKVLVGGGYVTCSGTFGCTKAIDNVEQFDPKTATWTETAPLQVPRVVAGGAVRLGNGKVLFAGGGTSASQYYSAEIYDPLANTSTLTAPPSAQPVPGGPGAIGYSGTLLPSGPWSACGSNCGKVFMRGSNDTAELFTATPEVATVGPATGPAAGGTAVTIEGTGLASVTSVKFGDAEATSVTPDSNSPDTKLVAVAPPQRAGTVPVTATSSGGSSANTRRTQFTYTGAAGGGSGGGATNPAATAPASGGPQRGDTPAPDAGAAQAGRARALRSCLASATRHSRRERRRLRRGSARQRAKAKRHLKRHTNGLRRRCLARHGRTPGRIAGLSARAVSNNKVELSFLAPGTDRSRAPAAHSYLVKQSRRPIRGARGFRRAQTLCRGSCRFDVTRVGAKLRLTITDLRPGSSYYYAIAARDNVSRRLGPRSGAVRVSTR